jgi:hypothetical protein
MRSISLLPYLGAGPNHGYAATGTLLCRSASPDFETSAFYTYWLKHAILDAFAYQIAMKIG